MPPVSAHSPLAFCVSEALSSSLILFPPWPHLPTHPFRMPSDSLCALPTPYLHQTTSLFDLRFGFSHQLQGPAALWLSSSPPPTPPTPPFLCSLLQPQEKSPQLPLHPRPLQRTRLKPQSREPGGGSLEAVQPVLPACSSPLRRRAHTGGSGDAEGRADRSA